MRIIVDIVFIVIFALSVIITAKKGFLNSLIGVFAVFLSIVVSLMIAPHVSEFVYNKYIENAVYETTYTTVNNSIEDYEASATDKIEKVYDSLPKFLKSIASFSGLNSENMSTLISDNSVDSAKITNDLLVKMINPALIRFLNYVFVLIFFIVILFVSKSLSKLLSGLIRGNLLGTTNMLLGAGLGCIRGCVFVILAYSVLSVISNIFKIDQLTDALLNSKISDIILKIL